MDKFSNETDRYKRMLQNGLFSIYRAVVRLGVLNTRWGRALFEAVYLQYKAHVEAGPVELLQRYVRPGTVVIDVGANVGFFTLKFGKWVSAGGKVVAIEPEHINYERLQHAVAAAGLDAAVETVNAAAAETVSQGWLEVNPLHPGDHKLGAEGVPVSLITIDHLVEAHHWPEVSLIKIDVQGAEGRVLTGAAETIKKFRPALFVEVDDEGLKRYGTSTCQLLTSCIHAGYTIHILADQAISPALQIDQILEAESKKGYFDALLLPEPVI